MIRNPFSRKPKTPLDQALDAFDSVRSDAADYAATIRDAASDIADTLVEIGPPATKGRRLPVIAAAAAAALGVALVVRSRLGGGSVPEVPAPAPVTPPSMDNGASGAAAPAEEAEEEKSAEPASGDAEEAAQEPDAATAESGEAEEA